MTSVITRTHTSDCVSLCLAYLALVLERQVEALLELPVRDPVHVSDHVLHEDVVGHIGGPRVSSSESRLVPANPLYSALYDLAAPLYTSHTCHDV